MQVEDWGKICIKIFLVELGIKAANCQKPSVKQAEFSVQFHSTNEFLILYDLIDGRQS
jgi:hypothetical protein